ncbi:unnamed protein product [Schistosoma curassoni]|uniref:Uncharacterized protein n=1 Tax=Schistosoma curassoni TaxID=6186 RepID=A0A183L5F6_9TREM|nr:unnamed protein product [Schistosoma curassoni]
MEEGFSEDEAKSRIFIMDSKGLIVTLFLSSKNNSLLSRYRSNYIDFAYISVSTLTFLNTSSSLDKERNKSVCTGIWIGSL